MSVRIDWGALRDYDELARFHYRAGRPASVAKRADGKGPAVLTAREGNRLVGVLVVANPTLNGAWRDFAWPGRYVCRAGTPTKREAALRLNRELRCLARVIVEPRDRGRGVAKGLVRHYLSDPITPATEAIAAMGWACPFFERAGMTAYRLPTSPRDQRLIDALAAVGLEPSEVITRDGAAAALERTPWLERELLRWAYASCATKARTKAMAAVDIARVAAATVSQTVTAYAHGGSDGDD